MQFPSQNSRFLCNRPDGPLKASGRPAVPRSFSVEDVWTSEQHCLDARSTFSKLYTLNICPTRKVETMSTKWVGFQKSTLFGKFLQDVRMTWQHVRTLSSISEYFGLPFRMWKGVMAKTVRTLSQAVRTWTLLWKLSALFWKGGCSWPSGHSIKLSGRPPIFWS
jgi:hypothetical protein